MCRRQILLNAQLCHRALQHSQACGHLQLGLGTADGHQFHAALNAAAAVVQNHQPLVQLCRSVASLTTLGQQQGFRSNRQHCQQWAASLSTTPYSCSEEDLRIVQAEITENEYHKLADETLDFLQEKLEVFVEDMDIDGGDVEHAQGVLTVKLGSHGTYVINKQTPNRQIWLSSPLTGPFRYDYHEGSWVYHRDGRELLSQLQQELKQLLGSEPDLVN